MGSEPDTKNAKTSPADVKETAKLVWGVINERKFPAALLMVLIIASALSEALAAGTILPLMKMITGQETGSSSEPWPISCLSDYVSTYPEARRAVILVTLVILANFIGTLIRILTTRYRASFTYRMSQRWRNSIINQYLGSKLQAINRFKKGTLVNNIIAEPTIASKFIFHILELIMLLFSTIALIAMMWVTSWQATAACIVGSVALSIVLYPLFSHYPHRWGKRRLQLQQELTARTEEDLAGITQIKAFSMEDEREKEFAKTNKKLTQVRILTTTINQVFRPILDFVLVAGICVIICVAPRISGQTLTELSPLIFFMGAIGAKVSIQLSRSFTLLSMITNRLPSMKLVHTVRTTQLSQEDTSKGETFSTLEADIEFRDVSLSFDDKEFLSNFNMTIPKGKAVYIVGRSGSGKTTIMDLIVRLTAPDKGGIYIGDSNLNQFSLNSWRSQIGLVSQDSFMFNMSILDNILAGNPNASRSDAIEAAKQAHAHEFIEKLPDSYDTELRDRGSNLSGGQRQRLALARAIVRNPSLYILDEPTSAVDNESTELILETIHEQKEQGKTVVVVAHDALLIKEADLIYVLDDGKIKECGPFEDLMKKRGVLYNIMSTG